MIRKSFLMTIHPGNAAEYEKRHRPIWDELADTLKAHGIHTYSIFLHEQTNTLFAYAEFENEERWQAIAKTEVCQRWWRYMADIMPTNPDSSPVSHELREVFNLNGG